MPAFLCFGFGSYCRTYRRPNGIPKPKPNIREHFVTSAGSKQKLTSPDEAAWWMQYNAIMISTTEHSANLVI
jgi:hypothetical protein